jgi:CMP-N,N'-diacetyllegionaminic acid synthase
VIGDKKVLAIIPARGGSKGVPHKNIRLLGGKPLITWTIEAAQHSRYIDRLIISSDDMQIIEIAKSYGCEAPFVRPSELAQDDTPGIDPILHALGILPGYDFIVLLQPTSPLRIAEDIDGCIETCFEDENTCCVSVTEPDKSPFWMYTLDEKHHLQSLFPHIKANRRQDLPYACVLNGAVYVADTTWLIQENSFMSMNTKAYVMPKERSMDVDTIADFNYIEWILHEGWTHGT